MSTDTIPSPAAWRLQTLTIPALQQVVDLRVVMHQVEEFYATEPNEELAAAKAGDYLEGLLLPNQCIVTVKRGRFWTEFVAKRREQPSPPPKIVPFTPDFLRVQRGDVDRAWADQPCATCRYAYAEHAPVQGYLGMVRSCDGRLIQT